jgi:hypothetical protein
VEGEETMVVLTMGGMGRRGTSIGRAARLDGGSAWSSLVARWKRGGGELMAKMDAGWSCKGIGTLI